MISVSEVQRFHVNIIMILIGSNVEIMMNVIFSVEIQKIISHY